VLEAALDLLLEKQARRKALVRRPRRPRAGAAKGVSARDPRAIPAAVERAVRTRDGDCCQFPLDAGGVCGSTWRVQLHHIHSVARGGQATVENLRCLCEAHHQRETAQEFGEGMMRQFRRRRPRPRRSHDGLIKGDPTDASGREGRGHGSS
jgi:5-methylcytosine-specific restriction endonuclease McrA